ncbi:S41 family peptidase [Longimicrobium sp.]|uniref:S41 family peptidase n=1 Tax=Longimicrobium sp. TaxID=2029185 RepID=UPI002C0A28F3|nr:S41 family peptidase [Longimicrobium sp.]HSU15967.1 S41 family peptidase [Longimicrobium sp.]
MRTRTLLAAALLATTALPIALAAQAPAPVAERRLDAATRRAVVDSAAKLLIANYAFADTGRMLAAHLRARLAAGAFDGAATEAQLGEALTREMQAFNHDGHLYTAYRPAAGTPAAMALASWKNGGPMRGGPRQLTAEEVAAQRRANYGFARVEKLDGNVGYLEITQFMTGDEATQAIDAAMAFLGHVDAMIVDVRRNGGGNQMAHYVASWFLPDGTPQTWNYTRIAGDTMKNVSVPVGGAKRLNIPVYVLTSGRTFSAAEAFAFTLQSAGRARVVGTRTGGGGYNNMMFPLTDQMGISISIGHGFYPTTGRGWEGAGVQPDIATTTAEQALAAAHADALKTLAERETDPMRRQELAWTRETVESALHPVALDPAAIAAYAGTYGNRVVSVDGGRLMYQRRADRPADALTAITATEFAPTPAERIDFVRDASGAVIALRVRTAAGDVTTLRKTN